MDFSQANSQVGVSLAITTQNGGREHEEYVHIGRDVAEKLNRAKAMLVGGKTFKQATDRRHSDLEDWIQDFPNLVIVSHTLVKCERCGGAFHAIRRTQLNQHVCPFIPCIVSVRQVCTSVRDRQERLADVTGFLGQLQPGDGVSSLIAVDNFPDAVLQHVHVFTEPAISTIKNHVLDPLQKIRVGSVYRYIVVISRTDFNFSRPKLVKRMRREEQAYEERRGLE